MKPAIRFLLCLFWLVLSAGSADAELVVPDEARAGLQLLYEGDFDRAIAFFRTLQNTQPEHPLGYLLEANALWWQRWCNSMTITAKGFVDALPGKESPLDAPYRALLAAARTRAQAYLAHESQSAEAYFYLGMTYALEGRLAGLRRETWATASAGKKMRAALLRARRLDPQLDDALLGLGLYNYYVVTLSPLVKLLRFLLFIPGGNKEEGVRQLEQAAARGVLVQAEARFWLGKNLRNYDRDYMSALTQFRQLVARYPQNPLFHLLIAGLEAQTGSVEAARRSFARAAQLAVRDCECYQRVRELAAKGLAQLGLP